MINLNFTEKGFFHPKQKKIIRVAYGIGGIGEKRQEGDGITPIGVFAIRQILVRDSRISAKTKQILYNQNNYPICNINPSMIWCDDGDSPFYNQLISDKMPYHHEVLAREDDVYNVVCVLNYNDNPIVNGKGSAIFIHYARANYAPTAGCIGFMPEDMDDFLSILRHEVRINIKK